MSNFAMCFSKDFEGNNPLSHIGGKLPTYLGLLKLCRDQGWNVFAVTRKTYKGKGVFNGVWLFNAQDDRQDKKFKRILAPTKMDLVFDWTNGLAFPPEGDLGLKVVDSREFKILCNDKWKMYQKLSEYMPHTYWIGGRGKLISVLPKIKTDWVVLKPINGLKGKGVFVGPKNKAIKFKFEGENPKYIAQEFINTSGGINGIAKGLHDLRVVVINSKVVWCHVRTPKEGMYTANVGQGGALFEIDYNLVPEKVKEVVKKISEAFYREYDNPLFSVDFGIQNETPYIFEVNDQIGFPRPEMGSKNKFLEELVLNFKSKI